MITEYPYTKSPVNIDDLQQEINDAGIGAGLVGCRLSGDDLRVVFDPALSTQDELVLDGVVAAHEGIAPAPGARAVLLQEGVKDAVPVPGSAQMFVDATGRLRITFSDGSSAVVSTTAAQ